MAPKAGREAKPKDDDAPKQAPPTAKSGPEALATAAVVATATFFVALAALAAPISQLNLAPVYGSIPAALYHRQGITLAFLVAYIAKSALRRHGIATDALHWIGLFAYYVPVIQWLLFKQSELLGPRWGPLVTEALTLYPFLVLAFVCADVVLDGLDLGRYGARAAEATPAVLSYVAFSRLHKYAAMLLPRLAGVSDFFNRVPLQLLLATLSALPSRSKLLIFAVPALLHTMQSNPHHYSPSASMALNQTLREYQYRILDRRDSVTGYISVLENYKDGFRVLRCDHSLLGGEWLITPARTAKGQTVKESIYGVFNMLESLRLIKTDVFTPDDEKDALFIGLGTGSAPKSFIKHGINTTIVELDPVVHEYATKYFELPTNHTAYISDAVPWVADISKAQPESFDFIVHDVFTGGAEPTALFTLEFLQGLHKLLKEDGSIAINYAGDLNLPAPNIIINTIFAVFPTCKVFRDTIPEQGAETFLNLVVFCVKSLNEIEFRGTTNEDYLGSMSKREFLPPDEGLEIKFPRDGKDVDILKIGTEELVTKYHPESAVKHWWIMRTVMPDGIWENW